jgi:outer membrane protein TolC
MDIERRPELAAVRARRQALELDWKKAGRQFLPSLSAHGSLDWDSEVSSDFEQSYFAGIVAEWEAFTGFRRGADISAAREQWQAARALETKLHNALNHELTQARISAEDSRQRLEVAEKTVESAKESLRITRERYEEGAADITDLLTAQVGLSATQSRRVAAYYDYLTALSNIQRARGVLSEDFPDALKAPAENHRSDQS